MDGIEQQREYGDYQTPGYFTDDVLRLLRNTMAGEPDICIEPTCGVGNFLISGLKTFPRARHIGIEINPEYIEVLKGRLNGTPVEIYQKSLFEFDFSTILNSRDFDQNILVFGNPPWVNSSTLSSLDSGNLPVKSNFKNMRGFDAITGSANFDICEFIILQMIGQFKATRTTMAFLCKTTVARNVFKELHRQEIGFTAARLWRIDTNKIFRISADGCLFYLELGKDTGACDDCDIYEYEQPGERLSRFGFKNGKFYSNLDNPAMEFDGECEMEWRQGVKHDCSKVMELKMIDGSYFNKLGEQVCIEDDFVYKLIKSSQVKQYLIQDSESYVIVTQSYVREDTTRIQGLAPATWHYLNQHLAAFESRKSSIYNNSPPFSMFGIGEYSFAKFKVGISGFYKQPRFSLLYADKPIMMDDTCYFLSFESYQDAYTAMLLLNSSRVQDFISKIAFLDAKRPYTKKVLERISFKKCLEVLRFEELVLTEAELGLKRYITAQHYDGFKAMIDKS